MGTTTRPDAPGIGPTLPEEVRVTFPALRRLSIACQSPLRYEVVVPIRDALGDSSSDEVSYETYPGHKRFRSSATAIWYDHPQDEFQAEDPVTGDWAPDNREQLETLAKRIAESYYRWRLARRDISYPGTVNYDLDGTVDAVYWTYSADLVETRVSSPPYDHEPEDLSHGLPIGWPDGETSSLSGDTATACSADALYAPDAFSSERFLFVWYPDGGIPAATHLGRKVIPSGDYCEVMILDADGTLCGSGVYVYVDNSWSQPIGADRLGCVECWQGRLWAKQEDCVPDSPASSSSGSASGSGGGGGGPQSDSPQ